MTKFQQAALNVVKVAGHILASILVVGGIAVLTNNQAYFTSALVSFGIPVSFVNLVLAAVIKFLTAQDTTLGTLGANAK